MTIVKKMDLYQRLLTVYSNINMKMGIYAGEHILFIFLIKQHNLFKNSVYHYTLSVLNYKQFLFFINFFINVRYIVFFLQLRM